MAQQSAARSRRAFAGLQTLALLLLLGLESAAAESLCSSCSIYILDLAQFAGEYGYPTCDLDTVVTVNPDNGVVYLGDTKLDKKVSHKFGTHSAPWYLYKAIQNSNCVTDDIDSASVIYVYDYCYYIWWLAFVHSLGRERRDTPGDHLIKGWTAITKLPRWQKSSGRDFIFYDSHPGFVAGHSAATFVGMYCNEFRHATHIVVERPQRNVCQSYLEIQKLLITPYVPNVINTSTPLATLQRPSTPKSKRNITAIFRGRCTPYKDDNTGKKLRYYTVQALEQAGPDVDVHCSEPEFGHPHEDFAVMLAKMEHSVFCLVLTGDAQSTRRLSEIFMAGCIPVFIGPPYNSMPLAEDVPYKSVGVFFNVSDHHEWMPTRMEWQIHATERAAYAQEARWWTPDADVADVMIPVETVGDIMGHLRNMPDSEIRRKLTEMETERHHFTFQERLDSQPPHAAHSIVGQLCSNSQSHQRKRNRGTRAAERSAAAGLQSGVSRVRLDKSPSAEQPHKAAGSGGSSSKQGHKAHRGGPGSGASQVAAGHKSHVPVDRRPGDERRPLKLATASLPIELVSEGVDDF